MKGTGRGGCASYMRGDKMSEERGARPIDWIPQMEGSPGIVVDADVAARTHCTCYKIDDTEMCFSKGIIGTLSKPQIEAYCPTKVYKEQGITKRVKSFKEAVDVCKAEIAKYPKGERLEPYLTCMSWELAKRGIEI